MRLRPLFFVALTLATGNLLAQPKPEFGNYAPITAKRLRAHLEFVAHDLLEGRNTPSRGLDIAAEYIASQMKLFGLEPGGVKGTYFQPFPVKQVRISSTKSRLEVGNKKYQVFDDFMPGFGEKQAKGEVVYVGHGYRLPAQGIDPYKGLDVKGKIVLRVEMIPKGWDWKLYYEGKLKDAEAGDQAAINRGAAGVLVIQQARAYDFWDKQAQAARSTAYPMFGEYDFSGQLPTAVLSPKLAKELLEGERLSYDQLQEEVQKGDAGTSFALEASKVVDLSNGMQEETTMTRNVIAIVRGSDPKLKAEYVAVGAHYDHVGMNPQATGDKIFNGADDDGSGTVALIEMAHALALGPKPKRSVIFVWHAGEEQGLWGSDYFTKNPTVPIKSIVAQFNIDMIGRSKPVGNKDGRNAMLTDADSIYIIGSRRLSDEFADICAKVNKQFLKLNYNYHYDKPNDPESLYSRSDHYNYARYGIPIAFFFDGVHEDYHQVGDEAHKIDYKKLEKVTRTIFATAWTVANRAQRSKVVRKE